MTKRPTLRPWSIGDAARLAGIAQETLRIWERRYRLVTPGRTEGGHRLYGEEDVEILRAAKRLVDAGARIGAIAKLPRPELLARAARVGAGEVTADGAAERDRHGARDAYAALIDELVDAARTLDGARTTALLDRPRLLTDGRELVRLLYLPLMRRVGDLWESGLLPVGVEHFVEKLVTARLHAVLQSGTDAGAHRALCACPPGERHEAGLLAAAIELRASGFAVSVLGADTPVAELAAAATTLEPDVVVLAVTTPLPAPTRRALVDALGRPPLATLPLLLGGPGAEPLAEALQRGPTRLAVPATIEAAGAAALRLI